MSQLGTRKNINKSREAFGLIIIYTVLIIISLIFIIPFLWLVLSSLKSSSELFAQPPAIFPKVPQIQNYIDAVKGFPFVLYLKNTLVIIFFNIVGTVLSSSIVAYGFSRVKWKGRDALFIVLLATMMMPFQTVMIPLFLLYQKFGWIGTFLPLTATSFFGNPFFIFLLKQFFSGIPFSISQSAKIDGANEFIIFTRLILPLSKPAITTVVIFTFMRCWNDFIGPLIFLNNNKKYTLAIGVQQLTSNLDPRWNLLMSIGVLMVVPVLLIFFALQKYFIQGIAFSGIKG